MSFDPNNLVPNFDDKDLGIIAILIIAIFAMYRVPDPTNIITQAITAIAAFVVGEKFGSSK